MSWALHCCHSTVIRGGMLGAVLAQESDIDRITVKELFVGKELKTDCKSE